MMWFYSITVLGGISNNNIACKAWHRILLLPDYTANQAMCNHIIMHITFCYLWFLLIFNCNYRNQKKCPSSVRKKGIFWSDVSVFLRPANLSMCCSLAKIGCNNTTNSTNCNLFWTKNNKSLDHYSCGCLPCWLAVSKRPTC